MTEAVEDAAVVTVVGDERLEIPLPLPDDHGFETRTLSATFRCSTGSAIPGEWAGLAVDDLLRAASVPGETTHVLVTGDDGFTVCVPVTAALDGVLAFEGVPDDEQPRFVAPGISGTRTVRRVRRLEATVLDRETDPESLEQLRLDEQ
jgi:DMSO/TMAO reductase YedYZ molybdopterin-dependent catalytic subunit